MTTMILAMIGRPAFKILLLLSILGVTSAGLSLSLRKTVMSRSSSPQNQNPYYFLRFGRTSNSSLSLTMDIAFQHPGRSPEFVCTAKINFTSDVPLLQDLSIQWINDERILLSKGLSFVKTITINSQDCEVSEMSYYSRLHTPRANGNIAIVVNNDESCHAIGWCKTKSPSYYENVNTTGSNTSNWLWHGTRVEEIDENLSTIRYLNTAGTFKFRLYNSDSDYKELLSLRNSTDIDAVTANLTICLVRHRNQDKVVTCYQFNENGELEFAKTIFYPEPVVVSSIIIREGEGLLFVRSIDYCNQTESNDCEAVYMSKFSKNQEETKVKCMNRELFQCFEKGARLDGFDANIKTPTTLSFTSLCDYGANYEIAESSCEIIPEESVVAVLRN